MIGLVKAPEKLPWLEQANLTFVDSEGFRTVLIEGSLYEVVCGLTALQAIPREALISMPDRAHKPRAWTGDQINALVSALRDIRGEQTSSAVLPHILNKT